jgi:hypothetical protein
MVTGDMPPPLLDPDEEPRAPRGPFCIPLRTSMRPTIASLDSRADYQSAWPTRLLGENVKIYSAEPILVQRVFAQGADARTFIARQEVVVPIETAILECQSFQIESIGALADW